MVSKKYLKASSVYSSYFLDTTFNNLKLIFITVLIGGFLGLGYYLWVKPYYESSMTLGSIYYRGQLINNTIENLNSLCKEENYKSLTRILKLPPAKTKNLKSIEIEPIVSPKMQLLISLYDNTEGNKHRLDSLILSAEDTTFQIKVQVYDTTALSGLDTSLVNHIKQNRFVGKRIEIERSNLRSRRAKLIKELVSLDTLKRNIAISYRNNAGGRTGTNNVILDDKGTNPIDIYREDLRFYEQILRIEKMLYINSEIEIIEPFIAFAEPKSGTIFSNILKGIIFGFILAFILILIIMLKVGLLKLRIFVQQK